MQLVESENDSIGLPFSHRAEEKAWIGSWESRTPPSSAFTPSSFNNSNTHHKKRSCPVYQEVFGEIARLPDCQMEVEWGSSCEIATYHFCHCTLVTSRFSK